MLVGAAVAFASVISLKGTPQMVTEAVLGITDNVYLMFFIVNVLLLGVGWLYWDGAAITAGLSAKDMDWNGDGTVTYRNTRTGKVLLEEYWIDGRVHTAPLRRAREYRVARSRKPTSATTHHIR